MRIYETSPLWHGDITTALRLAQAFTGIAESDSEYRDLRALKFAFLNRACELACVPLTQHYAEISNGDLDLVWVTYRPEAAPTSPQSIPTAMVYLGSVDNLTEDQARSRAIGW